MEDWSRTGIYLEAFEVTEEALGFGFAALKGRAFEWWTSNGGLGFGCATLQHWSGVYWHGHWVSLVEWLK